MTDQKSAKVPAQKHIQQNIVSLSILTKIPLFQAPEEKKKKKPYNSFNKANFSLNRNLFKNETNFVIIV